MIHKEVKTHYLYFLFQIIVIALGIILALQMQNKQLQMAVIIITTILYIGGGIVHHVIEHDVNSKIVIEYILIGSLGMTIVLFFLQSFI